VDTAVVAVFAGAVGAGPTGVLQLRRDRIEALRQRQLDAADAFAAAMSLVLRQVKMLDDSYPKREDDHAGLEKWHQYGTSLQDSLLEQVAELASHAPRVEVLFGVESAAAIAANRATWDLTEMAKALRPPINQEIFSWTFKLAAGAALRFHDEAHTVVTAPWWRRRAHKPRPDDAYEELVRAYEDELRRVMEDDDED
jgi:hypothetical protein